jgi:hypothetical protein
MFEQHHQIWDKIYIFLQRPTPTTVESVPKHTHLAALDKSKQNLHICAGSNNWLIDNHLSYSTQSETKYTYLCGLSTNEDRQRAITYHQI